MGRIDDLIMNSLEEAKRTLDGFMSNPQTVVDIKCMAELMAAALANNNKLICCGNGGSLCDATHFAEELTGRYRKNRNPLPAIAINDSAYITCVANDFDFDEVFARYVEAVGEKEDILLAISTSGNSGNIVKAAIRARECGLKVVSLTQEGGNRLSELSDITIAAPKTLFPDRTQEIHIKVLHILVESIEAIQS